MAKTTVLFSFAVLVLALALVGGVWADACYTTSKTIPATCTGGTISSDALSGGCRVIVCAEGANSITVKVCNKPGDYQPQFFEMYRTASAGTPPKVCLGTTCVQNNGFVKSGNFPICLPGGLTNGLVSYYGENGNHNDAVGPNHASEIVPESVPTTGKIGSGFYYGSLGGHPANIGSNDPRVRAIIPGMSGWPQASISLWMKANHNDYAGTVIQVMEPNNGDYGHRMIATGVDDSIYFQTGYGGGNGANVHLPGFADGNWHHIVMQWDKQAMLATIYVDGTLADNSTVPSFGPISDQLWWGAGFNGYGFNGRIDEIGVWNRVLTAQEVTQLYNGGAGKAYPFS